MTRNLNRERPVLNTKIFVAHAKTIDGYSRSNQTNLIVVDPQSARGKAQITFAGERREYTLLSDHLKSAINGISSKILTILSNFECETMQERDRTRAKVSTLIATFKEEDNGERVSISKVQVGQIEILPARI